LSEGALGMRPLFRILGSLEVEGAGPLGGPQQRALLRRLLLSANSIVSVDRLVDAVWGETAPEHAREALATAKLRAEKALTINRPLADSWGTASIPSSSASARRDHATGEGWMGTRVLRPPHVRKIQNETKRGQRKTNAASP
jgi:hypothetical protein